MLSSSQPPLNMEVIFVEFLTQWILINYMDILVFPLNALICQYNQAIGQDLSHFWQPKPSDVARVLASMHAEKH